MSNLIQYQKKGEYLELTLIDNTKVESYRVIERVQFRIGKDDLKFCRYVFDKLGIDIHEYNKVRTMDWQ